MCIQTFCQQGLGAKAITASCPDETPAYEHVRGKFELLIKISIQSLIRFFVNIQGVTVRLLSKVNFLRLKRCVYRTT